LAGQEVFSINEIEVYQIEGIDPYQNSHDSENDENCDYGDLE
jgi:hypothetical protein